MHDLAFASGEWKDRERVGGSGKQRVPMGVWKCLQKADATPLFLLLISDRKQHTANADVHAPDNDAAHEHFFGYRQQTFWWKHLESVLYVSCFALWSCSRGKQFSNKKGNVWKAAPTPENVKTNCATNSVGVFTSFWPSAELCSKDENNTCSHHLLRNGMQWWNLCSQRAHGLCKLHSAKWKAVYYVFNGIGAYLQSEEGCFI